MRNHLPKIINHRNVKVAFIHIQRQHLLDPITGMPKFSYFLCYQIFKVLNLIR